MNDTLLTVKEVQAKLGISRSTAYKLISSNQLRSGRIGKKILVRQSDLDTYLNTLFK